MFSGSESPCGLLTVPLLFAGVDYLSQFTGSYEVASCKASAVCLSPGSTADYYVIKDRDA